MSMPEKERTIFELACDVVNLVEEIYGHGNIDDEYIKDAYKNAMILANSLQAKEDKRRA